MDPFHFDFVITRGAADVVGELYSYPDITRTKAQDIVNLFGNFARHSAIVEFSNFILKRLEVLGEEPSKLASYASMFQTIQFPFQKFDTEWKSLEYFKQQGWYIPPEEIKVVSVYESLNDDKICESSDAQVPVQFISLRNVLKKLFELPQMFQHIMSYVKMLQTENHGTSNVMQTEYWQAKVASLSGDSIVLPIALYQDEIETNNALGTHRGRGKIGTIYAVLPFLPPELISKTENIILILLYNSYKQKQVPLIQIYGKVVEELLFLEATGITIETENGSVNLRFSLIGMVGDNLAIHGAMGFTMSFSANHSCRFCLATNDDYESILKYTDCTMRTEETYNDSLKAIKCSETGIAGLSVVSDIKSTTTLELLVVDLWHDLLEGDCQYDLGLNFNEFLKLPNFDRQLMNKRLGEFVYFEDDIQSKPVKITDAHVRDKVVKMSASEMLCMFRNIGLLYGHLIPIGNNHWKLTLLLKHIIEVAMATVVYDWLPDYFASCISEYLNLRRELFPNSCKTKHHLLVHYPQVMKKFGPLKPLGTIRCESKNHDIKVPSKNSRNRLNNEKNLAIKNQLALSHRLQKNLTVNMEHYKIEAFQEIFAKQLPDISCYSLLLNFDLTEKNAMIEKIKFTNCTLKKNAVVMIPGHEERQLFVIHVIIKDSQGLISIITNDITRITHYSEHYQAHMLPANSCFRECGWKCLTLSDLHDASFSFISVNGLNEKCIPKRWI